MPKKQKCLGKCDEHRRNNTTKGYKRRYLSLSLRRRTQRDKKKDRGDDVEWTRILTFTIKETTIKINVMMQR